MAMIVGPGYVPAKVDVDVKDALEYDPDLNPLSKQDVHLRFRFCKKCRCFLLRCFFLFLFFSSREYLFRVSAE